MSKKQTGNTEILHMRINRELKKRARLKAIQEDYKNLSAYVIALIKNDLIEPQNVVIGNRSEK